MPMIKLKEITTKIGSGATPLGGKNSYKDSGISLVRSMNVYDYSFKYDDLAFIDETQAEALSNVEVAKHDILLNITGASVARCCMIPVDVLPARVNQHVSIIRVNPSIANPYFVLSCINSPHYKQTLLSLAHGGATREALTKETIEKFEIPFLTLDKQSKIASILSAYNNLIENNSRRVRVLEEMAQTIYDEWFVKYRFPGHSKVKMVDSELGKIPEGWEVVSVKQVVKRLKAGITYTQNKVLPEGAIPVIDQSKEEYLGFHNNEPAHLASPDNPIIIFGDHTCKMQIVVEPFSLGPNVVPFVSQNGYSIAYLFFTVKQLVQTMEYKRHWNELIIKKIVTPEAEVQATYTNIVTPMLEEINLLHKKNLRLSRMREILLPKLISGEIDVEDMDVDIGDVNDR